MLLFAISRINSRTSYYFNSVNIIYSYLHCVNSISLKILLFSLNVDSIYR